MTHRVTDIPPADTNSIQSLFCLAYFLWARPGAPSSLDPAPTSQVTNLVDVESAKPLPMQEEALPPTELKEFQPPLRSDTRPFYTQFDHSSASSEAQLSPPGAEHRMTQSPVEMQSGRPDWRPSTYPHPPSASFGTPLSPHFPDIVERIMEISAHPPPGRQYPHPVRSLPSPPVDASDV